VIFEGEPPERKPIVRDSDPVCAKIPKLSEEVVVDHGKLKDVLVRIKNGTMGEHKPPAEPIVIDQKECMYTPRVVGMMSGQRVAVRNSDPTNHNVGGLSGTKMLFNKAQPPNAHDLLVDGPKDGVLELQCSSHDWMHAWLPVMDHPFFAVTAADGSFEIKNLPQGTYTLEAWHPKLGLKTLTVVIGKAGRANVTARFSYKRSEM
jgi:plastocyanin